MKKLLLTALLSVGLTTSVFAVELPEAPKEVITQAIEDCKAWAKEDEIAKDELYSYVLNCVNSDLTDQEYKTVKKIDL